MLCNMVYVSHSFIENSTKDVHSIRYCSFRQLEGDIANIAWVKICILYFNVNQAVCRSGIIPETSEELMIIAVVCTIAATKSSEKILSLNGIRILARQI